MNKIERFRAMLRGHPVDHVPAGFWFHFDAAYHHGQAMAQRHIDYYRQTGMDLLKVMNDNGYGPIGSFMVRQPSDWAAMEPTPLSEARFQSHMESLATIVAELGAEVPIITTVFNPYHEAAQILWRSDPDRYPAESAAYSALREQLRQEPEPVLHAMQVITEDIVRFYRACITETGITGIYFSAKGGERDTFSDEEHTRWIKPYDLQILTGVGAVAECVVGHLCGKGLNLERFVDYPMHLANWAHQSNNPSLTQGKAILHGVSILGGLDERGPLVNGPREDLQAEIERVVAEMGAQGFMLGAGCTVPGDVNLDNLIFARQLVAQMTAE